MLSAWSLQILFNVTIFFIYVFILIYILQMLLYYTLYNHFSGVAYIAYTHGVTIDSDTLKVQGAEGRPFHILCTVELKTSTLEPNYFSAARDLRPFPEEKWSRQFFIHRFGSLSVVFILTGDLYRTVIQHSAADKISQYKITGILLF